MLYLPRSTFYHLSKSKDHEIDRKRLQCLMHTVALMPVYPKPIPARPTRPTRAIRTY